MVLGLIALLLPVTCDHHQQASPAPAHVTEDSLWTPRYGELLMIEKRPEAYVLVIRDTLMQEKELIHEHNGWFHAAISESGRYIVILQSLADGVVVKLVDRLNGAGKTLIERKGGCTLRFRGDEEILFSISRGEGSKDIWRMNLDGTGLKMLVSHPGDTDTDPQPIPGDPNRILYGYSTLNWTFYREVRMRDLRTDEDRIIVPDDGTSKLYYHVSPDGKRLLLNLEREDFVTRMVEVDLETLEQTTILDGVRLPYPTGDYINNHQVIAGMPSSEGTTFYRIDLQSGSRREIGSIPYPCILWQIVRDRP